MGIQPNRTQSKGDSIEVEGKSVDSVKRTPKPKGGGEGNDALPRNEDKHQGRSDVIDGSLPEAGREQ